MHEFDRFPYVAGLHAEGIDLLRYALIALAFAGFLYAIEVFGRDPGAYAGL